MKNTRRIRVLLLADVLVRFAFFVMQNYLTDVWELSFTYAAGMLNIWNGIAMILPFFFLFLVDALTGNFTMLVVSSISYTLGIGLVAMSTPPVLANWTGTCKQYEPQCIGHTQKVLFYTGMSLLAVGISGYNVSLTPFLEEQDEHYSPDADVDNNSDNDSYDSDDDEDEDYVDYFQVVLIPVIAAIALPYIKSWSLAFGIPAISSAIATSAFLTGSFKYRKAERIKRWKLLSETQIGTTEFAVRTVPMWMTFIVCGIVTSTGNTNFIEQANRMDRKLGSWNVPIELLLLLSGYSREGVAFIAEKYPKKLESHKSIPTIIATAMIFSVLCCITAAKVETRRINVITRHGLLDKPNEEIPMKVVWLYGCTRSFC
ncbi:hypothetical protein ACP275_10G022200 [Erythranthe tilingii]